MVTYIVFDTLSKLTKIGKTKDINSRMSTMSTSNLNLVLIHTIEGDHEKELHFLFQDKNKEKEWYSLTSNDIEAIFDFENELIHLNSEVCHEVEKEMFLK